MFRSIRLRTKIFSLVSLTVLTAFSILTAVISSRTFEQVKTDAFNLAQKTADKYCNEIRAELQGARVTAETLAGVFESLKDLNITDRNVYNTLLKHALAEKEYITAFCVAYDPNALDGKDAEFQNKTAEGKPAAEGETPCYDAAGRFAPYWNKLGTNIAVEPLAAIDSEDWYKIPKRDLKEFITDPYPYELQGRTVMLESLIFPVLHKGQFIGIVSSDIVLDKLQEMVTGINPHQGVTMILSHNGSVAAHTNKTMLGKDVAVDFVYNMLAYNPNIAAHARTFAEQYLAAMPVKETGKDMTNEAEVSEQNTERTNAAKFIGLLNQYIDDPKHNAEILDMQLVSAGLAEELLRADERRLHSAKEARTHVAEGKPFTYKGQFYYTVYLPIRFSEETNPWSVAVSIPMSNVLQKAVALRNFAVGISLIAVSAIGVMLFFISGSIAKPINQLAEAAKIIGIGKFDTDVPVFQGKDEIGQLSAAFKFMTDEIKRLIKELQNDAEKLEEKNVYLNHLNELKDEFLANTSHELRTPLNGIIGIAESMIDGAAGPLTDEQKYNLALVSNSGKRLSNLVNDILDFAKLKNKELELNLKPVDLKVIVQTVIALSKPQTKSKDVALISNIDPALPMINADENRIQQILYNLIGNAVKFTSKGQVVVSAKAADGKIAVSVQDTGIGIAEDQFEKIFESFEQADGSASRIYGGTGLGLPITKKLVELHGGTITVQSTPGEGSTFTFTVLQADESAAASSGKPSSAIPDADSFDAEEEDYEESDFQSAVVNPAGTRILVVDDEPINIQVLHNLLSVQKYNVAKAYNGLEALAMFEQGEQFDLVLLDVMMPKMSGYDVCIQLRNKFSLFELPIIMLTAKNQPHDIVYGFQSGANDYVHKPFDKDVLLARIKTLLKLKAAMTAATAANKAKMQFLANMSHELRTPLNAVVGLTALLLQTSMDGKQRQYAEEMNHAASSLLNIINNILDFSSVDTGQMKLERSDFDLRKMMNSLTEYFTARYAASPVVLNVALDSSTPASLNGDPVRLRQVLINLIDNGYKFTEQGTISVKGSIVRSDPGNVMMKFTVTDTGIGMNAQTLDVVFAAFNQADNSMTRKYGGTGIGLTITRKIVELMGGSIDVDSKEGEGTTFTFTCPLQVPEGVSFNEPQKQAVIPPLLPVDAAGLKDMRILLVEDNKINAMIASELIRAAGADVTLAKNGQEALDCFASASQERSKPVFDLVLMDLQMPVMDGYEATQRIKSIPDYADIPIYALTAHAFAEERERCKALGMAEHLTKPIDVERFYEALKNAKR
ncbi:MAG: response regulator [Planctomycetaceae bacterium]|jgi:signal transduction histidine kinase|nr:response regulator [Planctomycetaceae bacterium]